jgi:hypothetical protein
MNDKAGAGNDSQEPGMIEDTEAVIHPFIPPSPFLIHPSPFRVHRASFLVHLSAFPIAFLLWASTVSDRALYYAKP